ncbi:MAG: phytanoyl-CoA dioxygenase family protein [Verrucomicrobia bacterium]|nr:phytanoyl-CoA dioxygenase family protein [Verrucomicrobiota bacterium]
MQTIEAGPVPADAKPFLRPFPALTSAERAYFDTCGYVVVPGVFSRDECARMHAALRRVRDELCAAEPAEPKRARVRGAFFENYLPHHAFMVNFYENDDEGLQVE